MAPLNDAQLAYVMRTVHENGSGVFYEAHERPEGSVIIDFFVITSGRRRTLALVRLDRSGRVAEHVQR